MIKCRGKQREEEKYRGSVTIHIKKYLFTVSPLLFHCCHILALSPEPSWPITVLVFLSLSLAVHAGGSRRKWPGIQTTWSLWPQNFPAPKWAGHKTVIIPRAWVGALHPSAMLHLWLLPFSFFWFFSSLCRNTCSRSFLGYGVWEIKLF